MPKRNGVDVSPSAKAKCRVKNEGTQMALRNLRNKKDAVDFGRGMAENVDLGQLKIQRRDETFQREYTYGKELFPPEGRKESWQR